MGPLEAAVDRVVEAATGVNNKLVTSPIGRAYAKVADSARLLPERRVPTPFGDVKMPELGLPELAVVDLAPESREAIKAAVAIDLSFAISLIPLVGDLVADAIEDTYGEKLKESLTDRQYTNYMRNDKFGPSTIAAVRALAASRP
jgi:hypothetical protein